MTDNRPYIELEFTGDTLTQFSSNPTLVGTDIVIDYGDGTTINYNGDFSHTYSVSGTYTIRIYGVTSLTNSCFRDCSGLTSVVIPDSVTSLEDYCFGDCSGLTNVVISEGVTSLAPYCFYECTNLTSIVIPNTVTSIGDACFRGCASLTNIVIPDSVTSIGLYCFQVCTSLTSIVIPESITSLSGFCFEGCSSLTNIHLKWSSSTDIIQYNSYWVNNPNTNVKFIIPHGTTNLYTSKGYSSNKLKEQPDIPSLSIGSKTVKALQIGNKIIRSITRVSDELLLYHTPSWVSAEPSTIQEGGTSDVYADTPFLDNGYIVHFFERVEPTLKVSAVPSVFQSGDTLDVYATVTDSDGSRTGEGRMVYFFTDKDLRVPSVLNVSADKSILSYSDEDKAVLTATVLDEDDEPIANRSVVFKQGSTVLDTVITDGSGEASYEYSSQGVGDVTITVECMSLQETFVVHDYLFVPTLDNNRQFYQISGTTTISNNEMYGGSAKLLPAFDNSGNWELTFKVKFSGNNCCALLIPSTETTRDTNELLVTAYENAISWYNNSTITQNLQGHHLSANTYYNVTITKNGSSISVSIGNNSKTTTAWNSVSASNLQIGVGGWGTSGNVCTIKDIVIKPL